VSVPARREQVAYARRRGLSQRRSCTLLTVARSALGYRSANLVSERGAPLCLRSDNGPEFVSRALLKWIVDQGIETALIDPGKPWQNGTAESFNGKFRDECLSLEWFLSPAEAKIVIETWRRHYNEVRPHSSLGYLTPAEFVTKLKENDAAPASATGRDAAVDGASAPPARCSTVPTGTITDTGDAGSLKLTVVRRIRAGQGRSAASAGAGCGAPLLRLAAATDPAVARGRAREPQEAAPAVRRGAAAGSSPHRTQAGRGDAGSAAAGPSKRIRAGRWTSCTTH
jgi:Integrase core domain